MKNFRSLGTRSGYNSMSIIVNRVLINVVILLLLTPNSALAVASESVLNQAIKQSSSDSISRVSQLDPAALIEEVNKKLTAAQTELADLPSETTTGSPSIGLSGSEDINSRRIHLKQLVFIYQGQLSRLPNLQSVQKNRIELEKKAENWSGFNEPSPHPFLRVDELKGSLTTINKRVVELESWLTTIEQAGAQVISNAEISVVKLRQADEAVEQAKNSLEQQARLNRQRELLILQNQIDLARAMAFQIEKLTVQEELLQNRAQLQLIRKQLSVASENAELTQQDIEQINKNTEAESQALNAELKKAMSEFDLENKAEQLKKSTSDTNRQLSSSLANQILQAQRSNADIKLQVLTRMLVYLQMQRDIWNLRWAYSKVTDREKAAEAYDKIIKNQLILTVIHDYIYQQRQSILEQVTSRASSERDLSTTESFALTDQLRTLDLNSLVLYSRLLGAIETTQNLLNRCKQELDERFEVKSFSDYLAETLLTTREVATQVWTFELFAVQDNIEVDGHIVSGKRSVTVDKVVTALMILIVGYWFATRLSGFIEGHAVKRLSMDASLARIARRWILFLQVILLVVLSMMVVKIPLTIFAFMGGALAIGAGFGMQNMLKNLISGIMLLFERPFRPGDVVEVGGIRGRVIDIGVRSSQILDGNGIETLIPNSTFIEQNVTNWTLTSKSVRIVVNVGIAYGSPIKEVNRLLLDVASRHGLVLNEPAPVVLLEDFGSDALLFGLYVWVEINPEVSWKTIASDLRFMISKTLDDHGIEIAFPHRDVHLASSRPLEVRVISDTQDKTSADPSL